MKRIHDSLQRVFQRNRLVFWYDATGEWAETFEAFIDESVLKLKVARSSAQKCASSVNRIGTQSF